MSYHRYNLYAGRRYGVTYRDSAVECPQCGYVWDDESDIFDRLGFFKDGQKAEWSCPQCGQRSEVCTMISLWRYSATPIADTEDKP